MADKHIANSRYIYVHDTSKWPSQTVDIHHVDVRKTGLWSGAACFIALVLVSNAFFLLLGRDKSVSVLLLYLIMGAAFIKLFRRKLVKRESVVIIPEFGVQLETHYRSGKAVCRFVSIDKILKPVLNECVTPLTCYWSLALILHKEDELMLIFKETRPPLKILLPIWKAICAAIDSRENFETS